MSHRILKRRGGLVAAVALLLSTTTPAMATNNGLTPAATEALVQSFLAAVDRPVAEPRAIPLPEAVSLAVENNPGIRARAYLPEHTSHGVLEAAAAYEPMVNARLGYFDGQFPVDSVLDEPSADGDQGGGEAAPANLDIEELASEVTLSKLLGTGATLDLTFATKRTSRSTVIDSFDPKYEPELSLGLEQPLLRNIGGLDEQTTLLIAKEDSRQAQADFEAELADFVGGVVTAYWDSVLAGAELDVGERSLELARELVREAEAGVRVGVLPPVAVKEAAAEAATREEEVLRAENEVYLTATTLSHLVMLGGAEGATPMPVHAVQRHLAEDIGLERAASLRTALARRAEIASAAIELEKSRLDERRAHNQRLPELNLVANYGLVGLGGDRVGDLEPGQTDPLAGSHADAVDELFTGDFFRYAVGVEVEVPLSNAGARARHAQTEVDVKRSTRELHEAVSQVALEIERAIADVESGYKRVSASQLARELAEENLHNQKRRFELGAVTTKDVLDFQQKLAAAMASEALAVTDHAKAVSSLRLAEGTLLESYDIEIQGPDKRSLPWWSRF